jgi:uncharacterized protein (DUF2236 family)
MISSATRLLSPAVARILGAGLDGWLPPYPGPPFDFARPAGERALFAPDSIHWRVFKNPVCLYIGGVAAVTLELAEPGVRTGVWRHSRFRADPVGRMRHTGHAAMVSIYGPAAAAENLIAHVRTVHATVSGTTPSGKPYSADDPDLLRWVQATTSFGFAAAYSRYACPLDSEEIGRFYCEAEPASRLYGVVGAPRSQAELEHLFRRMLSRLEPSAVLDDFLRIMRTAPMMPDALRPLQSLFVRAAMDLLPDRTRERLRLAGAGLGPGELQIVRCLGAAADRIPLKASPAVQACLRLGLPGDWLYRPPDEKRQDSIRLNGGACAYVADPWSQPETGPSVTPYGE